MAGWSVCYKYRNAANAANAELDRAIGKLNELSSEINKVSNGVSSDLPNSGSFCSLVSGKSSDINSAIATCISEIEEMKSSSYKEATRRDDIETEKNKAAYYASLKKEKK